MKVITRAVYDMTDPRFWSEDFEAARVEEESFEYEGEVALCGRDSDATGGSADGQGSQNEGSSGGNDAGGGYSMHDQTMASLSGSQAAALGASGTESAANLSGGYQDSTGRFGSFDSNGNRTSYASGSPTSYGVANYSREYDMPTTRALQTLQDQHINTQFQQRRDILKATMPEIESSLHSSIEEAGYSPTAALGLHESVINGQLSNLNAAGVLSEPQANAYADTYGDFGYQVGRGIERGTGLDLNMAMPEDVQTPSETYTDAFTDGQINADGSLTAKGYFNAYGPLLGVAAAPIAGAVFNATASLPQTLAAWGAAKVAGTVAASPISEDGRGAALGGVADVAASQLGIPGTMTGLSPALIGSWAGNMIDLADARNSANPDAGVTTGGYDAAGGDDGRDSGSQSLAGSYLSTNMVAQNETTDSVNHAAEYKARQGSSSGGLTGGYDYSGLNMFS